MSTLTAEIESKPGCNVFVYLKGKQNFDCKFSGDSNCFTAQLNRLIDLFMARKNGSRFDVLVCFRRSLIILALCLLRGNIL